MTFFQKGDRIWSAHRCRADILAPFRQVPSPTRSAIGGGDDASGEVEDSVLWSNAAVAQLEATVNMNDFRKRARKLGLVIKHRNSDGRWRNRSRADIVKNYRQQLPVGGDRLGSGSSHP